MTTPAPLRLTDVLSPSELRCVGTRGGFTVSKAGEMLFLSAKTVYKHLQSTYRKLGIDNCSQFACRVEAETAYDVRSKH